MLSNISRIFSRPSFSSLARFEHRLFHQLSSGGSTIFSTDKFQIMLDARRGYLEKPEYEDSRREFIKNAYAAFIGLEKQIFDAKKLRSFVFNQQQVNILYSKTNPENLVQGEAIFATNEDNIVGRFFLTQDKLKIHKGGYHLSIFNCCDDLKLIPQKIIAANILSALFEDVERDKDFSDKKVRFSCIGYYLRMLEGVGLKDPTPLQREKMSIFYDAAKLILADAKCATQNKPSSSLNLDGANLAKSLSTGVAAELNSASQQR